MRGDKVYYGKRKSNGIQGEHKDDRRPVQFHKLLGRKKGREGHGLHTGCSPDTDKTRQ